MLPVDPVLQAINLRYQSLVRLEQAPARDTALDEYHFTAVLGVFFKETLYRTEPFRDALGIVHPVEADADNLVLDAQFRLRRRISADTSLLRAP